MTRTEAQREFILWINAHPDDKWEVHGGSIESLNIYSGTATINGPDIFAHDHIEIKYEK